MAAAAVGPVQRPKTLGGRALLQEQLAASIEYQQRERSMQDTTSLVAQIFAQMAEPAVCLVHEDQSVRICHNPGLTGFICGSCFVHTQPRRAGLFAYGEMDDSRLRNRRASAGAATGRSRAARDRSLRRRPISSELC